MLRSIFGFLTDDDIDRMSTSSSSLSSDWNGIRGKEYIKKFSESNYNSFLKTHKSVLVMFYAPWCGPCKMLKPEFALAASSLAKTGFGGEDAVLASCNCDDNPKMVDRYRITGYPTLLHFQDGQRTGEYNQGRRASDIISFMTQSQR